MIIIGELDNTPAALAMQLSLFVHVDSDSAVCFCATSYSLNESVSFSFPDRLTLFDLGLGEGALFFPSSKLP